MEIRTLIGFISEVMGVVAVVMLLAVAPRLAPLPIAFREPQKEVKRVALLYAVLLVFSSASLFIPGWDTRPTFGLLTVEDVSRGVRSALLYRLVIDLVSLMPIGVVAAMCERCNPWHTLGWNKRDLRSSLQLGIALGLLTIFLTGRFMSVLDGVSLDDLFTLLVWMGIALVEETIFRGYIQSRLSARFGPTWGLVAAALMFTLYALPALVIRPDAIIQVSITLVHGLVVGWIFRKTGHVLGGAIYRGVSSWIAFI